MYFGIETSSPKGNYRTPEIQQVKSPKYFKQFKFKSNCFQGGTSNSKVSSLISPTIKLIRASKHILIANNFDDESKNNEVASMVSPFSIQHYKSMENS